MLIDVACVYLFEMPLNLRVQWRKRVLCSWGQSDLCQSYAELYRDWGAGGPMAFRLAVEGDEKVKKGVNLMHFFHSSSPPRQKNNKRRRDGMKMFQGEGEKVSLERSGMHGEISPGPRSIEGEEQYQGEAITLRVKPSPCSPPAPLFAPSLHPSFNLDSLSDSLHLLPVAPFLNVRLTIIPSLSPSFLYLSIYE